MLLLSPLSLPRIDQTFSECCGILDSIPSASESDLHLYICISSFTATIDDRSPLRRRRCCVAGRFLFVAIEAVHLELGESLVAVADTVFQSE